MTVASPRLDPRLAAAARIVDDPRLPYAETCRRVGDLAVRLGLTRPSYDTIRLLVRAERAHREEIRRLLEPVAANLVRGAPSPADVDRVREAVALRASARRRRRR